jgi:hypothetical protein
MYFEYGTTPSLGLQTPTQAVSTYTATNYFNTISVSPNTLYYYRIVGVINGQKFPGETVPFQTPGTNTYVPPVVVNNGNTSGFGGGSSYVSLSIVDQSASIAPGNAVNYSVTYQNVSQQTLSGAILNVILPKGVTFSGTSQGVLTTNNTVAVALGTLAPGTQGIIQISTVANQVVEAGNNFVATATLAFTLPSRAQDSAIAYSINNVMAQNSNLGGLALFGNSFFPTSLLGWVLIIGLLLVLIFIARYFYHRGNTQYRGGMTAGPTTRTHYDAPAPHDTRNDYHQ